MDSFNGRRLHQFSLLNLTLLVALCGAVFGLFALRRSNDDLRERLRVAQGELETLNIYDASMVWARTVKFKEKQWRWRIYFPTAQRYRLHVKTCDDYYQELELGPGEFTVTAAITPVVDGSSELTVQFPDQSFRFYVNFENKSLAQFSSLGDLSQSFETTTKIDLMHWMDAQFLCKPDEVVKGKGVWLSLEPVDESAVPMNEK